MACEYTGKLTSSLFATNTGPSVDATYFNAGNPKFGEQKLNCSLTESFQSNFTSSLQASMTYIFEAQISESVQACIFIAIQT